MSVLGDNIKKYRTAKNLTQKELAEKIGITAPTITKYENGKLEPNMSTIKKIADCLDISTYNIIAGTDPVSYNRTLDWNDPFNESKELSSKYFLYPIDKNKLINLLKEKNITPEQLSDISKVSFKRINSIVTSDFPCLLYPHLKRISDALDVPDNYLILNSEGMDIYDINLKCILEKYLYNKGIYDYDLSAKKADEIMDIINVIIKYLPKVGE